MKRHLNDGKKLRLVIKDYFDGVEKILKKHKKDLTAIFYSYVKSKRQTDNEWDEQIVNNIKIKKVHVLKNMMSDKDWEDLANSPYPLQSNNVIEWDHAIDLEIYIGKIVKQEAGK